MKDDIKNLFYESLVTKQQALESNLDQIEKAIKMILKALKGKKKLLFFGNGGSAADSQHIAAEFIGRFKKERPAYPAIALTTDSSVLTALGNDYGYDTVFARQIEGLGVKGDIAIGISTSGNSKNVVQAIKKAKKQELKTITVTGNDGGALAKLSDISIVVPSDDTARIQESHLCIFHTICEIVEQRMVKA